MKNTNKPAKRVNLVSLKMVRESSFLYENRRISCASDAAKLAQFFLEESDREKFCIACLDTKMQPMCLSTISIGTLNSSLVHPRETFKIAITANSASIILFHNHPSGDPTPSKEDIEITKRLMECGEILGIEVVDHIIIGSGDRYCSLKEKAMI